jgi:hypothetical protein
MQMHDPSTEGSAERIDLRLDSDRINDDLRCRRKSVRKLGDCTCYPGAPRASIEAITGILHGPALEGRLTEEAFDQLARP